MRLADEQDRETLREWINQDPAHRGVFEPEDFMGAMVYEDSRGPVMYIRPKQAMRLDIQFCQDKMRVARAMSKVMPALCESAKQKKFSEIVFDSISDSLIRFCERRFGAKRINDYRKVL